jgi:hypothetical protein
MGLEELSKLLKRLERMNATLGLRTRLPRWWRRRKLSASRFTSNGWQHLPRLVAELPHWRKRVGRRVKRWGEPGTPTKGALGPADSGASTSNASICRRSVRSQLR